MPTYYLWTIGCQMNKADSEQVASYLQWAGYQPTAVVEEADLVVLNSCVVRQSAENRVVNKLCSLKELKRRKGGLAIVVTGCIVDSQSDHLKRNFPYVDLFLPPQNWQVLYQWAEGRGMPCPEESKPSLPLVTTSVSAFVPIIQGCDNFCTYCIVPYRRGREKSRGVDEIICQVKGMVQRGVREVVLLGQNVDSYGHDLPGKPDLADLLTELNDLEGLWRIRFLTSHPKDMKPKLIEAVARLEKVCEYISLPVQAGNDNILKAMGRGYTVEQYCQLVSRIRSTIPGVALSTDVIVGFPGESEEQFQRTARLLQELRFDTVHVAAYSSRPGTLASKMFEGNITYVEKNKRRDGIEELEEGIAGEINAQLLGKTVEVLVEGEKKGKWQGRTRTDKLVFFADRVNRWGQLVKVRVEKTSPWALQGILEE